jgi:hypothetical protein
MLSGSVKSGGGAKGGSIGAFVQKNPDFMKMDASKRNELLTTMKMEASAMDRSMSNRGNKELSKTAKDMMEKMIKKQLQKRQKEIVSIRACWFGNGRITKDGKIYDANNKVVGQIDQETMKITMGWSCVGKYKDDSFTLTKLSNKIAAMNKPVATAASGGGLGSMGSFYGSSDSGSSTSWW